MPTTGLFIVFSYLVGSIPSGVILARLMGHGDPRKFGSGNTGAANLTRLGGKPLGMLTFLFDFLKGFLPTLAAQLYLPPQEWLVPTVAATTVVAHCYSPFLRFSGGKGVATNFGALLPLAPIPVLIGSLSWGLCYFLKKISSLASLTSVLVIPIAMAVMGLPNSVITAASFLCLLIFYRHKKNIRDLLNNKEWSFSKNQSKKP